jgi:secreted trypsin-like serine protease
MSFLRVASAALMLASVLAVPARPCQAQNGVAYEHDPYKRALKLAEQGEGTRIILGNKAWIQDNPWHVGIALSFVSNDFLAHFCGGSYVGSGKVVTAAHCVASVPSKDDIQVIYNSDNLASKGKRVAVKNIRTHPGFSNENGRPVNDVAVIELEDDLAVSPIPLADRLIDQTIMSFPVHTAQRAVRITGWGLTKRFGAKSEQLLDATVPLQDYPVCNEKDAYDGRVLDTMLCAGLPQGGSDACSDDSGGPASVAVNGVR